jgi:hypothetical protein
MKVLQSVFLVLLLTVTAFSQPQGIREAVTSDFGLGAFANDSGPILLTVDSALVSRTLDNPYVMFYAYMASKNGNRKISVAVKDIRVLYNGRELTLPTISELRGNYNGINRDYTLYHELGKEGVIASWVRMYMFPPRPNFYPPMNMSTEVAVDTGSMFGFYGFQTPLYLKNPGFSKGDHLTFVVRDRKNPDLMTECEVVIK